MLPKSFFVPSVNNLWLIIPAILVVLLIGLIIRGLVQLQTSKTRAREEKKRLKQERKEKKKK
eukprot:m.24099 g.24099  ORF g.24099 m.24099 type:complete len:62 (+) comp28567_c0_seq4:42-227(+)